jgi:hypothetical protein
MDLYVAQEKGAEPKLLIDRLDEADDQGPTPGQRQACGGCGIINYQVP